MKVGNSMSSGVQRNRCDPNLIPVPALQPIGMNFSLTFSTSGRPLDVILALKSKVEGHRRS